MSWKTLPPALALVLTLSPLHARPAPIPAPASSHAAPAQHQTAPPPKSKAPRARSKAAPAKSKAASRASGASASHGRQTAAAPQHGRGKGATAKSTRSRATAHGKAGTHGRAARQPPSPRTLHLASAFRASAELRPMAQQLALTRTPAAFAGVETYAAAHPGEAAAAAHLALGHAFALDHHYPEALAQFRLSASSEALGDYADFLGAQAAIRANQLADAAALLNGFDDRHPDSIFIANAPVLLATIAIQQGNGAEALRVLEPLRSTPVANSADFRYALGRAYQTSGATTQAAAVYRELYAKLPLSGEALQAQQQLQTMGMPLSAALRKIHADQLFNVKRYADAAAEYQSIERNDASLAPADRDALTIYAAVCDLRLKRANRREIERLPVTDDDSAALKMYMLAEISRSEGDRAQHDTLIAQMVERFPHSRWLEEALYSGGNMYLLLHDSTQILYHYGLLVRMFPDSAYAPSAHWRMAWTNYRIRQYPEAARLMEEQIARYPGGQEIPSALYWRARIYEDEEHNLPAAAAFYRSITDTYTNFYYALLARRRLAVLSSQIGSQTGSQTGPQREAPAAPDILANVHRPEVPELTGELPEDDPHLIKARLLANAALNEYIGPEIDASPDANEWGALAQAEIYSSFGEITRALQSMKHSGISFFALPMDQVPVVYWRLLFPRPFWPEIAGNSERNGLDPFLVASLIRQESEFNAGAISRANAYGLMQLLPSVGKAIAKKQGLKGFNANQLLVPAVNLQLGAINLRQVLDRFGGQPEYTLAAYNAGDVPVRQWMSAGDYKDTPEFVESIPYTETRDYVEAILRNREMYRALYAPH